MVVTTQNVIILNVVKPVSDTDSMSHDLKQDPGDRWKKVVLIILKILGAIFFLYMFVFSIGFLSDAFQVLGGSYLNRVLDDIQGNFDNIQSLFATSYFAANHGTHILQAVIG